LKQNKINDLRKEAVRLYSGGGLLSKELVDRIKGIKEEIKQLTMVLKKINTPGVGPMLFAEFDKAARKAEELRVLHARFFEESRHGEKENLKKQIGQLEWELIEATLREKGKEMEIKKLDQFRKTNTRPFFLWKLNFSEVFREKGGFDVMIANPPYIKEYVDRKAFDGVRTSPYYQGKMDIWYLFACKSLDILKSQSGILAFIAQNNWVTSSGASKMRIKVTQEAKILNLVDFGSFMIFDRGIQTMVMLFQADKVPDQYVFNLRRLLDGEAVLRDVLDMLEGRETPKAEYLRPRINRKTYASGATLNFSNSEAEEILSKIVAQSDFTLTKKEVAQGIVYPQDRVIKSTKEVLGGDFAIGDGIFVLNNKEKKEIPFLKNELELLKPSYTTEELGKYYGNPKNKEWVIYTDSGFNKPAHIKPYPNIKKHLDKFADVITSDNWPYGLHRSRDERFFKGEKIAAVRKCAVPTFTYTDFDCYVSATFYVIKSDRIDMKYLTGLLNSRLIAFWLKNKGKMQGSNYQIDKDPLLALPIKTPSEKQQDAVVELVDEIISLMAKSDYTTSEAKQQKTKDYCDKIDQLAYTLYDLTPDERKFVEDLGSRKNESSLVKQD
ncbi:MAG: Eco57I restriction-modification methylase domain-containing protein, partial [Elusimicrobia bacterium]|nr:Eco57I restriction-modification methylase domain-containing protein [Elusimicrobiota bacterium]